MSRTREEIKILLEGYLHRAMTGPPQHAFLGGIAGDIKAAAPSAYVQPSNFFNPFASWMDLAQEAASGRILDYPTDLFREPVASAVTGPHAEPPTASRANPAQLPSEARESPLGPPCSAADDRDAVDLTAVLVSALARAHREGDIEAAKQPEGEAGTWRWFRSLQAAPRLDQEAAFSFYSRCLDAIPGFLEMSHGSDDSLTKRISQALTALNLALEDRRPLAEEGERAAVAVQISERDGERWASWVGGDGPADEVPLDRLVRGCFAEPGGFSSVTAGAMADLLLKELDAGVCYLVGFKPSKVGETLTLEWAPAEIDMVPESEFDRAFQHAPVAGRSAAGLDGITPEEGEGQWSDIPDDVSLDDEAEFWATDPDLARLTEDALAWAYVTDVRNSVAGNPSTGETINLCRTLEGFGPGPRAMGRHWQITLSRAPDPQTARWLALSQGAERAASIERLRLLIS
jgi:hypothetical protein